TGVQTCALPILWMGKCFFRPRTPTSTSRAGTGAGVSETASTVTFDHLQPGPVIRVVLGVALQVPEAGDTSSGGTLDQGRVLLTASVERVRAARGEAAALGLLVQVRRLPLDVDQLRALLIH